MIEFTKGGFTMSDKAKIYLVATSNRRTGVQKCLNYIRPLEYEGKRLFIKPNFNTADECPGSTHNDTLEELLAGLKASSPASMTIGERSGPANAADVFRQKKIPELCENYGVKLMNFEELKPDEWINFNQEGLHWPGGFEIPKAVTEADAIVATCCLKTHAFGGVFSASLKLGVGFVPKDFQKLHGSPDMRKMIAEINLAYKPDFILMDGIEVFTDGGPMEGTRAKANVMLIGQDRIAIDAVGLAVLKSIGSNKEIMSTPIFRQEQIARAVELNLGISCPGMIELVTDDAESEEYAKKLRQILEAEQ
jgi:uncharacterized protein (DUF362 family)